MISFQEFIRSSSLSSKPNDIVATVGSLGISRVNMPQIGRAVFHAFLDDLRGQGIAVVRRMLPLSLLRPTQGEISADGVERKIIEYEEGGIAFKSFIISSDYHILDGHHTWAALLKIDPHRLVECFQVDVPMSQLLKAAHSFDGVSYKDIQNRKI